MLVRPELPADLSLLASRYDVLSELGRGGMGIVYKARDRQTGDTLAIKVLKPSIARDADLIERFKNELLLARRITHKNVCRVYDLADFGDVMAISMEYVPGESLRDVLNRPEGLSIRYGLHLVRQIAGGLDEAHAQGVVHRDLKPSNIQVAPNGHVKVMDFGIARSTDAEQQTGSGLIVGTPAYMSPEQVEGKPPDARTDIYALGLVMFEMFCGEPVFSAESTTDLVTKHVFEKPRAPRQLEPDLPRRIERAILRCLEKDPARRFQTIDELLRALDEQLPAAAPDDTAAMTPLAGHLLSWQRADTVLTLMAVAAAVIFLQSTARTSLAPQMQVSFDHSVFRRIVQEHLERLQLPPSAEASWHVDTDLTAYSYLGETHGADAARRVAGQPVPFLWWHMMLRGDQSVAVNNRGELVSYQRLVDSTAAAPPLDDARKVAERAVSAAWRRDLASLTIERTTTGQQFHSFTWLGPNVSGLQERYSANVDGRGIQSLSHAFQVPATYRLPVVYFGDASGLVIALGALIIAFYYRRRINVLARWRLVGAAVTIVVSAGYVLIFWSLARVVDYVVVAIGLGLIGAIVWTCGSVAVEAFVPKSQPDALRSLILSLSRRGRSPAVGLAVLRGTLLGVIVAGVDALAVWAATTYGGAWLHTGHIAWLARPTVGHWPVGTALALAGMQALSVGLRVCVVAGIAQRLLRAVWLQIVVAVAVLAVTGGMALGRVQPDSWRLAILAVDFLVLVTAYRRCDVMTIIIANFTLAFAWLIYPVFVLLRQAGPVWPTTALVAWVLLIALAITVTFEDKLTFAYRRLTGSLD